MRAGQEVDDRGAGLHRRLVGEAGGVHHAGEGLHGEVHGRVVAVGAIAPIARGGRVDEPREARLQRIPAQAQPVHHAGPEILHQHVGGLQQAQQQRAALFGFQVERDGALVGVEHGERQRRAARTLAVAQAVAFERLDLDHVGARHGQQERAIGTGIDARQIDDANTAEGPGSVCRAVRVGRRSHGRPLSIRPRRAPSARCRAGTQSPCRST